jgi:hypothetical protein
MSLAPPVAPTSAQWRSLWSGIPILLLGCSSIADDVPSDDADASADRAYYASQGQADSDLLRFEREHPNCQLWTNWQKMCSRTGPDGDVLCRTDPGRPVSPSAPFCISETGEGRSRPAPGSLSSAQQRSLRRFCAPEQASVGPTGSPSEDCGFTRSRPFNGYRLAARLHPWCERWHDALNGEAICSSAGQAGLPSCEQLASTGYENSHGLSCGVPRIPAWCDWVVGLGRGGSANPSPSTSEEIPLTAERQEGFAVRGIFCRRRS